MVKDIQSWQILVKRLPINIHNFCRSYLVMSLANNSNLKRWKISKSEMCSLCTKKQAQLHIFDHCLQALKRYKWRHNLIIQTFCNHTLKKSFLRFSFVCWHWRFWKPCDTVEITTTKSHNYRSAKKQSITRARPDIAIETRDTLTVIELTCPYETNMTKSRQYKETRYIEIKSELFTLPSNIQLIFLEVTLWLKL